MTSDKPTGFNVAVSIKADLSPIIKAIPKGVARVFALAFGKKELDNEVQRALAIAQAQRDCDLISSGQFTLKDRKPVPIDISEVLPVESILQIEEKQAAQNYAGNLRMAAEALKDIPDENIPDQEIDEDFFARWRREAKVIGNKELQFLWGKLLAGEIVHPESISLRTLDVVKNISSKEAACFRKIGTSVVSSKILVFDIGSKLYPDDTSLDDILMLNSAGLLSFPSQGINLNVTTHKTQENGNIFPLIMKHVVLFVTINVPILEIPGVLLSDVGRQIFDICDFSFPDENIFKFIIKIIEKNYREKVVSARAIRTNITDKADCRQAIAWDYMP